MSQLLALFLDRLAHAPAVLVSITRSEGSVPRAPGTWMAVFAQATVGTIGGGQLEWSAQQQARERLAADGGEAWVQSVVLGPSLGQCCGGRLQLRFEPVTAADRSALRQRLRQPQQPVGLFGGGHVGRALVQALAPLPYAVHWIDSRDEVFPDDVPAHVTTEHSAPVQAAVNGLPAGAHVLIMSFSHAEDLDIVAACLRRQRERADLRWVGLIGSRTKWASFRHRLADRGFTPAELAGVTCPIGLPGITDKAPAVIAAAVVAQLLLFDAQRSPGD
ncbi:MAG: xanthine dehydrogenase accessory protein XdhC [Hydrogenophaga sp.]